jgi:hypothetical protein
VLTASSPPIASDWQHRADYPRGLVRTVIAIREGGLIGFVGGLVTLLLLTTLLLAAVVLLLLPQSRAVFRKPRTAE